jgi:hypothetical protein
MSEMSEASSTTESEDYSTEFDELIAQFETIQKMHEDALLSLNRVKRQLKIPVLEESLKKAHETACQNLKEKKKSNFGKLLKEVVQTMQ